MIDEKFKEELKMKYNPDGSSLRKAQLRMLEILLFVDKVCKAHNIEYWIEGGTLLGAVRHVGFVPTYLKEIGFDTKKVALVCGPPIMIKFVLQGLEELGFTRTQVYTTLELRMKCGIGKCGRCNIGSKYVCKDGPVFRMDEIDQLPDEY